MAEPLLEQLRETERSLGQVAEAVGSSTPAIEASLRGAREAVEASAQIPLTVAVVGETRAARLAQIDAVLGAPLLAAASGGRDARVAFLRRAPAFDYVARTRDGRRVVQFARRMPDRTELFERSLMQARQERASAVTERLQYEQDLERARERQRDAEAAVERATADLAVARQEQARDAERPPLPALPAVLATPPAWWAVWLWLLRWLLQPLWRERLRLRAARAAHEAQSVERVRACSTTLAAAEQERDAARADAVARQEQAADTSALDAASARVDKLLAEREKYASEREEAFFADLRAMGDEIVELTIDYPAQHLPEGVTLLDVPSPSTDDGRRLASEAIQRDAHAFVVVHDVGGGAGMGEATSRWVGETALALPRVPADGGVISAVRRVQTERATIAVAQASMRLRSGLGDLSRAREDVEARHRKRLAALEGQRIPDPAQFRAGQLERAHAAIERSAEDALRSAVEYLRTSLGQLRAEWTERVVTCADRAAVEARVREINDGASSRIGDLLEGTSEHVARELQSATEAIEAWALEEMQARYQLVRRLGAETLMTVASDVTREDLDLGTSSPVQGALDAFEKQRVGLGLGGAAAGAALGTLATCETQLARIIVETSRRLARP
jgi:hypothetical protein